MAPALVYLRLPCVRRSLSSPEAPPPAVVLLHSDPCTLNTYDMCDSVFRTLCRGSLASHEMLPGVPWKVIQLHLFGLRRQKSGQNSVTTRLKSASLKIFWVGRGRGRGHWTDVSNPMTPTVSWDLSLIALYFHKRPKASSSSQLLPLPVCRPGGRLCSEPPQERLNQAKPSPRRQTLLALPWTAADAL